MDRIIKIVNQVLEEEFEIDAELLKPESLLNEDLGLDSLDAVDLIVMVDKQLGVRIEEEQARSIRTLEDVYKIIDELLKVKQ
ncbi:MAG: acyl carrier protein [Proteobacteria bacterium]|jgi:acyl carrier protein|nr:acyl carrier protein [Pseudomonadota bacterium]MDA3915991.1 acyl carrier protein [Deltaproteobacteria bacterium]